MRRTESRRSRSGAGRQAQVADTQTVDVGHCAWTGCQAAATTMCVLCGRPYCRDHCRRASLFSVFRARTDLPEDLTDLLNGLEDPRARVWMCDQCELGAPIPGGLAWSLG